MQRTEERATAIATQLLFFELEWAALDDERVEALLADARARLLPPPPPLASAATGRTCSPSPRSASLTEKDVTGALGLGAPVRRAHLGHHASSSTATTVGLEEGLRLLAHPDRERAPDAPPRPSPRAWRPGLRTRAFVFNTLLADKAIDDRLRELPDAGSRAATWPTRRATSRCRRSSTRCRRATTSRSAGTASRPACSGVDRLADYDRMASLADDGRRSSASADAKELVLDAYASFSPELADVARRFFDESLDRRPGPARQAARRVLRLHRAVGTTPTCSSTGRHAGATCSPWPTSSATALHAYLARPQGVFHQGTPLTLAETASVFGETVTFGRLLGRHDRPRRAAGAAGREPRGRRSPPCSARRR